MKKLALILLLFLFSVSVGKGLYFLKKGFSLRRIHPLSHIVSSDWSDEANQALAQPYRYLGRGRQCFAFESLDGQYVVKLPRTDIYQIPLWARLLPAHSYRKQHQASHAKQEAFVLKSFQIAYDELREQTALLAMHLGQSEPKGQTLTLIDALGTTHHLPVERTAFVLQYKRPLLMKAFREAMDRGDRPEAEHLLDALIAVVKARGEKGILNRDRSFLRNYGYDGAQAYQIDVGSFFRKEDLAPEAAYQKSIRDSLGAVHDWLAKTYPDMVPVLDAKLARIL